MSKKMYAVGAIVLGIVAIVATSRFQATRLTPGQLEKLKDTALRMDTVQAETKAETATPAEAPKAETPKKPYPKLNEVGPTPDLFQVKFTTSKGDFVVEVHKDWSPLGAERFYQLVKTGFYDEAKFFRVLPGFVVQFGIAADPKVNEQWSEKRLKDEPRKQSNTRGTLVYAKPSMPNARTTQVFINLADNNGTAGTTDLDAMGFTPFGVIVSGMDVVESLYAEYGESASREQFAIEQQGNAFLEQQFPKLDSIKEAVVLDAAAPAAPAPEAAPQPQQ